MKKTYITTMPDHIGAFLKASKCLASLGVNITRVSYNKAVDSHTLFIDAEGTPEQHARADAALAEIGYLNSAAGEKSIILLEFRLRDVPGGVTAILELIHTFRFNISYMSSQENGTDHQLFKMGLFVDDAAKIQDFIAQAEQLCPVRFIDFNPAEKVFDNSIFYRTFVSTLVRNSDISDSQEQQLLVYTNLAMQTLDERGLSPYRTFDSIGKFAELLAASRGERFSPRITQHSLSEQTELLLIEPPCGSNTIILRSGSETLFIDSGYACYRAEMLPILRRLLPGFDTMRKRLLLTHADVDHCGLLPIFDEIVTSAKSADFLAREHAGEDCGREDNQLHLPYIRICKLLTAYEATPREKLTAPWGDLDALRAPLQQIGFFDFADLHFEVYEGGGGHLPGEIVLIDYEHHIAFTGDVLINPQGLTPEQKEYNRYAPILMTSVDTDPALCRRERDAVLQRLGAGEWQIFGGHGCKIDYQVNSSK